MPPTLVAVEEEDRNRELLERARAFATGAETDLVVAAVATPEEYEEVEHTLSAIDRAEHTSYDEEAVLDGVFGGVEDGVRDVLGTTVEYELTATTSFSPATDGRRRRRRSSVTVPNRPSSSSKAT